MFIPYTQAQTSETSSSTAQPYHLYNERFIRDQVIFPFINFTCTGTIRRLIFVARLERSSYPLWQTLSNFDAWPHFYLWRHNSHYNDDDHCFNNMCSIGPSSPDQLVCVATNTDAQIGLIEMTLPTSVGFEEDDILGLQQQSNLRTPASTVSVLRHRRGYGLIVNCPIGVPVCNEPKQINRENQQMPYIAIKTGKL